MIMPADSAPGAAGSHRLQDLLRVRVVVRAVARPGREQRHVLQRDQRARKSFPGLRKARQRFCGPERVEFWCFRVRERYKPHAAGVQPRGRPGKNCIKGLRRRVVVAGQHKHRGRKSVQCRPQCAQAAHARFGITRINQVAQHQDQVRRNLQIETTHGLVQQFFAAGLPRIPALG